MGRKKKEPAATPETAAIPVKDTSIRKSPDTTKVERPLEEADYKNFQQALVARNREKQDLAAEVAERMNALRESKKKISALEKGIETDLSVIGSGVINEDRPCLKVEDYQAGTISYQSLDGEMVYRSEEMPQRQRQRSFNFVNPERDCYHCKYIGCQRDGDCRNYADCFHCPYFICRFCQPCGVGKNFAGDKYMFETTEEMMKADCYFCGANFSCQKHGEICRREGDCLACEFFSCDLSAPEGEGQSEDCEAGKDIPPARDDEAEAAGE